MPSSVAAGSHGVFDMTGLTDLPEGLAAGFTCVRMIGSVKLRPGAGNVDASGTYGIAVVTRDSAASGFPHPTTDFLDWYYLRHYAQRTADVNADYVDHPFDIRTKRTVRGQDRTLLFVIDSVVETIIWSLSFRLLLQKT